MYSLMNKRYFCSLHSISILISHFKIVNKFLKKNFGHSHIIKPHLRILLKYLCIRKALLEVKQDKSKQHSVLYELEVIEM